MPGVELKIEGIKAMSQRLGKLHGEAIDLAGRALYQEGEKIMSASRPLVPVFEGPLRASGHVQLPRFRWHSVEVVLGYGGAASGYAVFVHEGTGPAVGRPKYFPPPEALKLWAKKKLGDEGLAFVVARKIYNEGTQPVKFLEKPVRAALVGMGERIAAHIRKGWGK